MVGDSRSAGNFEIVANPGETLLFFNRPASWGCGLVGLSVAAPNERRINRELAGQKSL